MFEIAHFNKDFSHTEKKETHRKPYLVCNLTIKCERISQYVIVHRGMLLHYYYYCF